LALGEGRARSGADHCSTDSSGPDSFARGEGAAPVAASDHFGPEAPGRTRWKVHPVDASDRLRPRNCSRRLARRFEREVAAPGDREAIPS
jgi:hypothetical protein